MRRFICRGAEGSLPGLPPAIASLLLARGIATAAEARDFLNPDESQLHDPLLMPGMEAACRLIRRAVAAEEGIAVYGDYDCDGVCASVILLETLRKLGANASLYIPRRKEEGYGLNCDAVRRLAEKNRLLITVDCGITSLEEVALAKSLGMRVVLTDHHTIPDPRPDADVILHPQLGDYPCPFLCGAGVAYKLSCALIGPEAREALELCALATIADMVPLLGENRALAALGLRRMQVTRRPGLQALLETAGIRGGQEIGGDRAAFQLAPRINACGRMDTAMIAAELLTTRDPLRARVLAGQADSLNASRKGIELRILEEADAQARAMDLFRYHVIVAVGEGWESGVVGLVAGRLAERYGYPAVVLSRESDTCVGSARSACGVDLYKALAACRDLYSRFGGHRQAAGLTMDAAHIEEFRERLSAAVASQLQGKALMPETAYDAEIALPDITLPLIDEIKKLEPFGMGNPAPVFLLRGADVLSARAVGAEGAHLKMTLSQGGAIKDAIGFHMGGLAGTLNGRCDLAVTPVANTFNGRTAAECRVEAAGAVQTRFLQSASAQSLAILQELDNLCRIDTPYTPAETAELPPPQGGQGTLYLCRTAGTAAGVLRRFAGLDCVDGTRCDPRAYNAVWLCGEARRLGPYRRVVLCDGPLCSREPALLASLYPEAEILCLPRSGALRERLAELRFTVDELRAFYVSLRRGQRPESDSPQIAAMARVLRRMELIDPFLRPLPVRKADPTLDPLCRLIQGGD